jgi:hypothetical protein
VPLQRIGRKRRTARNGCPTLLGGGSDFLGVNGLLCGIELACQQDMYGGEVLNGFGIFDDPEYVIIVGYKDGSLRFPFWVPHGSASAPAFLNAIGAAGLGVLGSATLIGDPTCSRRAPLLSRDQADSGETANKQERKGQIGLQGRCAPHEILLP